MDGLCINQPPVFSLITIIQNGENNHGFRWRWSFYLKNKAADCLGNQIETKDNRRNPKSGRPACKTGEQNSGPNREQPDDDRSHQPGPKISAKPGGDASRADDQREHQQDADHLAGQADGDCQDRHKNDGQGG